mgnify:CR=1 FL=1
MIVTFFLSGCCVEYIASEPLPYSPCGEGTMCEIETVSCCPSRTECGCCTEEQTACNDDGCCVTP